MSIRSRSSGLLIAAVCLLSPVARADDDPQTVANRKLFEKGMQAYRAGAIRDAIEIWKPIYRDLGPQRGYRLSYDLGIAYEEIGDPTRAAERLGSFLKEIDARRAHGESFDALVAKEETDARARVERIDHAFGHLEIKAAAPPVEAQIDEGEPRIAGFVAYVAPGSHRVVFGHGEPLVVQIQAGETRELTPPAPKPEVTTPPVPTTSASVATPPREPPNTKLVHEVQRPFPAAVLFVTGGLAVASVIVPVLTYKNATDLQSEYEATSTTPARRDTIKQVEYPDARSVAYATLAIPITLAVATASLTAWYLLGKSERDVLVPVVVPLGKGGAFGLVARF